MYVFSQASGNYSNLISRWFQFLQQLSLSITIKKLAIINCSIQKITPFRNLLLKKELPVIPIKLFKRKSMENKSYVLGFLTLITFGFTAHAQVYKRAEDTVKLNKEYTEVSNDIASLTAKLTTAQNNMPGYQSKADAAESDAKDAAVSSSVQAEKATKGGVKEAKKAKRKSKKAYHESKDAKSASNDVGKQDDKIASLKGELAKKQERLEQLTTMRASINAEITKQ